MKRIILCVFLGVSCVCDMSSVWTDKACDAYPRYAFNTHSDFGKKHFIVGYPSQRATVPLQEEKRSAKRGKKDKTPSSVSYFTSVHDVRKEVANHLQKAKKSIAMAMFTLTDMKIADQLIRAHKSNVRVTVVTDKERMRDRHSKIKKLVESGVPVYYYNHTLNPNPKQKQAKDALMHHKFTIIDDEELLFGSLNYTKSGQEGNMENITITTKSQLVANYNEEYKRLLSSSSQVTLRHLE